MWRADPNPYSSRCKIFLISFTAILSFERSSRRYVKIRRGSVPLHGMDYHR